MVKFSDFFGKHAPSRYNENSAVNEKSDEKDSENPEHTREEYSRYKKR